MSLSEFLCLRHNVIPEKEVQTGGRRKPAGRDGSVLSHRQQRPKVKGRRIVPTLGGSAAHGLQSPALKLRKSPLRSGAGTVEAVNAADQKLPAESQQAPRCAQN